MIYAILLTVMIIGILIILTASIERSDNKRLNKIDPFLRDLEKLMRSEISKLTDIKDTENRVNEFIENVLDEIEELKNKVEDIEDDMPKPLKFRNSILEMELAQNRFLLLFNQLTKTEQNKFKQNHSIKKLEDRFSESSINFKNMKFNDILNFRIYEKDLYKYLTNQIQDLQKSKETCKKYKG